MEGSKGLVTELRQCGSKKDLIQGKLLHSKVVKLGISLNIYIANTLINMYSKCGVIQNARDVFESMSNLNVVSWTSLIVGYVENGQSLSALDLFTCMDCAPNSVTFLAAVKACAELATDTKLEKKLCLEKGMSIHRHAKKLGLDKEVFLACALVDMYSKCGDLIQAREVFERMSHRDVVTWTTLVVGYAENKQYSEALNIFRLMSCTPNAVALAAALKACGGLESKEKRLQEGARVHIQAKALGLDKNVLVSNTLIDMYNKCGDMHRARLVFDGMTRRDVVTWTALIVGYLENGNALSAAEVFHNMDCAPNRVTFAAVIRAYASLGAFDAGERIHDMVCELGLDKDETVANCLVDLYAKCGNMLAAERMFGRLKIRSTVSWNSLIGGYCSFGKPLQVLLAVERMQDSGVEFDSVTMLLLLTACSHAGMVEEGQRFFQDMSRYSIRPTVKHYACMVDMLGRANMLEEALMLVKGLALREKSKAWMALLVACVKQENVEISTVALSALVELNEDEETISAAYLVMRSLYERLLQGKEMNQGRGEDENHIRHVCHM